MKLETVKIYHLNGNPSHEYMVDEQGNLHGISQRWYENGQLWVQSEFVNGKRHGTYQRWHFNGQLWEQIEYVNGKRHGIAYMWNEDSSIRNIRQYDTGKLIICVDYTTDPIMIKMIDPNIESTNFIVNITSSLDCEGKEYEFTND